MKTKPFWTVLGMATWLLAATQSPAATIINVNLGGTNKVGFGAVGLTTNDVWNQFDLLSANATTTAPFHVGVWEDGTTTGAKIKVVNFSGEDTNASPDAMFGNYFKATGERTLAKVRLIDMPAGTYDVYVFGVGLNSTNDNTRARVAVRPGTSTPRFLSPYKYTAIPDGDYDIVNDPWVEGRQYVVFRAVTVESDQRKLVIRAKPGNNNTMHINGIQIVDTNANLSPFLPGVGFSPASGAVAPLDVTLSVPWHPGATIHYTTDGSTPTTSSAIYSTPISLTTLTTIKAFAVESGYDDGPETSSFYHAPTLPDPTFSPVHGGVLPVTLTMSVPGHGDATINYTLDGITPTGSSTTYTGALNLTTNDASWSANITPALTASTDGNGHVAASSTVQTSTSHDGWKAFDHSTSSYWRANGTGDEWVSLEFPVSQRITRYAITSADTDGPRDWTLEGWNGTAWEVLDTRNGQIAWSATERREFDSTNAVLTTKYRLKVGRANTAGINPAALVAIGELEFYENRVPVQAIGSKSDYYNSSVVAANYYAAVAPVPAAPVGPSISTHPLTQTVTMGGNVTLSVTASGDPTLTYQWSFNGLPISGATSGSHTVTGATRQDAGAYSVIVSNAEGDVISQAAILTVAGGANDSDGDGLSNAEEATLGTNVNSSDSDGDGVDDLTEVLRGTNPLAAETGDPSNQINLVVYTPLQ